MVFELSTRGRLDLQGDSLLAEESHSALLAEAEEQVWPLQIANSHQALSQVSAHRGRPPEALQRSRQSNEEHRSEGHISGVIDSLTISADILWQLGRFEEAISTLTEASKELDLRGQEHRIKNATIERVRLRLFTVRESCPKPSSMRNSLRP